MQYKIGDIVKGLVNRIEPYGAFVSLPGKTYGLLPKIKSSDYYDKDGIFKYSKGNSIDVVIDEITEKGVSLASVTHYNKQCVKAKEGNFDLTTIMRNLKLTDNRFIGQFTLNSDGSYTIRDIRRSDFSSLVLPNGKRQNPILFHPQKSSPINDKQYYEFNWTLKAVRDNYNYIFGVNTNKPFYKVSAQQVVEKIHQAILNYPAGAGNKIVNMLQTLSKDLTASGKEVFIYELLQNANDYPYCKDELVDVEFHITEHYLIFKHTGAFFNEQNVAALCDINDKDKVENKNTIGYKGIGFKTVFLYNNYVYLKTGDFSFRYDAEYTRDMVSTPYQILPIWTDYNQCVDEIKSSFSNERFRVQFALRPRSLDILREAEQNYKNMFLSVFKNERVILFIPNLSSVKIFFSNNDKPDISLNRDSKEWVVNSFVENIDDDLRVEINAQIDKQEETGAFKIPPKYYDFQETNISFACRQKDNKVEIVDDATIYCYLPTKADFGFKFLMNTDMLPTGPRDDIETIELNYALSEIAGHNFFNWIKKLILEQKFEIESIFELLPSFNDCIKYHPEYKHFIERFQKGFEDKLKTETFVPILKEGQLNLAQIDKIIYDTTGLSKADFLSDKELLHFANGCEWTSEDDEYLPHPKLRKCSAFMRFLQKYHAENMNFGEEQLFAMCESDLFRNFLSIKENNIKFLCFLIESRQLKMIKDKDLKVFLGYDNKLHCCSELYYNIDEHLDDLMCFSDNLPRLNADVRTILESNSKWNDDFKSFFKEFDVKLVLRELLGIDNVDSKTYLGDKENSIRFFHFLALHFDDGRNILNDYCIPFFDSDNVFVESMDNKLVYYPSTEDVVIRNQSWLSPDWIRFISNEYFRDDKDKVIKLLDSAGVETFSHETIFTKIINDRQRKLAINTNLNNDESCFAFAKYAYDHKVYLSGHQLHDFNLSLHSESGKSAYRPANDDSFFNSPKLEELQQQTWTGPIQMYSLNESYFSNIDDKEEFRRFLTEQFGVRELTAEIFFNDIVLKNEDYIVGCLKQMKDNISFWRWVKNNASLLSTKVRNKLIFAKGENEQAYSPHKTSSAYLPNDYMSGGNGIDSIIKKYYPSSVFVTAEYMEDDSEISKRGWRDFFRDLGVKTSVAELLTSEIIPNLRSLEDASLPILLAQERDNLKSNWNALLPSLRNLKLKCNDGTFRSIAYCKFVNCSSDTKEPFASMIIPDEYKLTDCSSDVRRLLLDLADSIPENKRIIQNISDWRKEKLIVYLNRQRQNNVTKEEHFTIIRELLSFNDEKRQELKEYTDKIFLLSSEDEWKYPKELTLGSLYKPFCDFEANGIGTDKLKFLSNEYGVDLTKPLRDSFPLLHRNFERADIHLLEDTTFVRYFWCEYLFSGKNPNRNQNLAHIESLLRDKSFRDRPCIPTVDGTKKAEDLYHINLVHFLDKTPGWESKFPCQELRIIIKENQKLFDDYFNFRSSLVFTDCLNSLLVKQSKEDRNYLSGWLSESYEYNKYDKQIEDYRQRDEAVWKNGIGEPKHISELYVVNPKDITLHSLFRQDEKVLDDSYISNFCIEKVCEILKIPLVTQEDGIDIKPSNCVSQTEQLSKLFTQKMLLVSACESQVNYNERFEKYVTALNELSFFACETISLSFKVNPNINRNAKQFYFDVAKNNIYYVGDWNRRRTFKEVVSTIVEELGVELDSEQVEEIFDLEEDECKNYIEEHFAKLLLLDDFNTLLDKYFWNLAGKIDRGIYNYEEEEEEVSDFIICDTPQDGGDVTEGEYDYEDNCSDPENTTTPKETHGIYSDGSPTIKKPIYKTGESEAKSWRPKPRNEVNDDVAEKDGYIPEPITSKPDLEMYRPNPPRKIPVTDWKNEENTPELRIQDASEKEIEAVRELIDGPKSDQEIIDEQYLARWRMYQALKHGKNIDLGDERAFVNNTSQVIITKSGAYIYTRSAKGGILYLSAFLWEKLENGEGKLCMYYGNKAYDFELIENIDQLIGYVGKDNILIQIKGKDKKKAMRNVFNGQVDTLNTHALIRIKSNERYNSLFLDTNSNNDNNDAEF